MELSGGQLNARSNIHEQLATLSAQEFIGLFYVLTDELANKMASLNKEDSAMDCYYNTLVKLSEEMDRKHVLQA